MPSPTRYGQPAGRLPVTHPLYVPFEMATSSVDDELAIATAATLVAGVPANALDDDAAAQHYLAGPLAEAVTQQAIQYGIAAAEPDLDAADQERDLATDADDGLVRIIDRRRKLPNETVTVGSATVTRARNRTDLLPTLQDVAAARELREDLTHREASGAGPLGWVIAVIIAVIEAGVTLRVFNVDPFHLQWGALTWLAVTVAFVIFNHYVTDIVGARLRTAREVPQQHSALHRKAFTDLHSKHMRGTR